MPEMNTRQQVSFTFSPLKDDLTPGQVETATFEIVGASGAMEVLDFLVAPDSISGRMHMMVATSVPSKVVITADADLGAGVSPIVGETSEWTGVTAPEDMATHFAVTEGALEPFVP